ncbi:hypothetical protein D3C76_1068670 [compost metagenome]
MKLRLLGHVMIINLENKQCIYQRALQRALNQFREIISVFRMWMESNSRYVSCIFIPVTPASQAHNRAF